MQKKKGAKLISMFKLKRNEQVLFYILQTQQNISQKNFTHANFFFRVYKKKFQSRSRSIILVVAV